MLFFGHIAVSVLLADITGSDRRTVIAGNLVPDVVDKTGRATRLFPRSRWLAHGLPALALTTAATHLLRGPREARAIALGYGGHLVCDLYLGGRVPWLLPFRPFPKRRKPRPSRWQLALYLLPEILGLAYLSRVVSPTKEDAAPGGEPRVSVEGTRSGS